MEAKCANECKKIHITTASVQKKNQEHGKFISANSGGEGLQLGCVYALLTMDGGAAKKNV